MKIKNIIMSIICMSLCSCNYTRKTPESSKNELEITSAPTTYVHNLIESDITTTTVLSSHASTEETVKKIVLPEEFTEEEKWLHNFFELNFDEAYKFARMECGGTTGEVEVCVLGKEQIEIYGRINNTGYFSSAKKYRESLSEYYSEDTVKLFMDNVTVVKKIKETDESYYNANGVNGRIYVELAEEKEDAHLTKYIEIDGVMYKDTGLSSYGTGGVFEYSKIVSMSDDEIVFTYPIHKDLIEEFSIVAVAEGRLVKEDGVWKFGWHLLYDNYTEKYNDIWYA